MSRRTIGFLVFASVVVVGCLRLGVWQLERLRERRDANRSLVGRLDMERLELAAALRDTTGPAYRRVRVDGRFDYEREVILTARGRQGSPGVHLVTPLRFGNGDSAVLVNRGWVYAPDGMTLDAIAWREGADSATTVLGFVESFITPSGPVSMPGRPRSVRRLAYDSLQARMPYALVPALVVMEDSSLSAHSSTTGDHPVRLDLPTPSEGSHQSYAIQWFAFAAIGMLGMIAVVRSARRGEA